MARFIERRSILERDEGNSNLTLARLKEDLIRDIHSHSVTYCVAIGPQKGRKVFTLQIIPARAEVSTDNTQVAKPRVNLTRFHGAFAG